MNSRPEIFHPNKPVIQTGHSQQGNSRTSTHAPSPPTVSSHAAGTAPAADKRRSPRYKCEGNVEFRTEGVDMSIRATITDISLRGCYVELPATSAVNTSVSMVLDVKGVRVPLRGIVRTSFPLLGMGIEFTDIRDEDKPALERLLLLVETGARPSTGNSPTPSLPETPNLLMIMDPAAALGALAKFFQNNQSVSRQQFAELVARSQDAKSLPRGAKTELEIDYEVS